MFVWSNSRLRFWSSSLSVASSSFPDSSCSFAFSYSSLELSNSSLADCNSSLVDVSTSLSRSSSSTLTWESSLVCASCRSKLEIRGSWTARFFPFLPGLAAFSISTAFSNTIKNTSWVEFGSWIGNTSTFIFFSSPLTRMPIFSLRTGVLFSLTACMSARKVKRKSLRTIFVNSRLASPPVGSRKGVTFPRKERIFSFSSIRNPVCLYLSITIRSASRCQSKEDTPGESFSNPLNFFLCDSESRRAILTLGAVRFR